MGRSPQGVALIDVDQDDLELLFAWRQDRELMRYLPSFPERLTWEEHWEWWLGRESRLDWMIVLPTSGFVRAVGTVHYNTETHEIGVIMAEKTLRNQGIGTEALQQGLESIPDDWCIAVIHPDNLASQRVFTKAGFMKTGNSARNEQEEWRWER